MRAELELALADGEAGPFERVLGDLREALNLLGEVESAAFAIVRVLVLDDDERLGELTARGLRRLGFAAESASHARDLPQREIVVFDLGLAGSLDPEGLASLKESGPIVLTGATDPGSRALAADLGASDYLVKPVDIEDLASAIRRHRRFRD
jgi:DNA-binding response OmpR family regulator